MKKQKDFEFQRLSADLEEVLIEKTDHIKGGGSDLADFLQDFFENNPEGTYDFVSDGDGIYIVDDNKDDFYETESGELYYKISEDGGATWIDVIYDGSPMDSGHYTDTVDTDVSIVDFDFGSDFGFTGVEADEWVDQLENLFEDHLEDFSETPALKVVGWLKTAYEAYMLSEDRELSDAEFAYRLTKLGVGALNVWAGIGMQGVEDFMEITAQALKEGNELIMGWIRDSIDPMNPDAIHTDVPQDVREWYSDRVNGN